MSFNSIYCDFVHSYVIFISSQLLLMREIEDICVFLLQENLKI